MQLAVNDLWTAAGVLLGFQITAFLTRLGREIAVGDEERVTWMPPADVLNLASMVLTTFGVFLAPLLGLSSAEVAARVFGLALILFVGYPFALAGHYDMYNRQPRTFVYCTFQETIVLLVVAITALGYSVFAFVIRGA